MALLNEDEQTTNYLQIRYQPTESGSALSVNHLGLWGYVEFSLRYIMS